MTHQPEHDPLGDLAAAGVAVWLDDLSRELLADGGLQSLIAVRHVVGVTVNTMPGATLEAFADHGQVSGDTMTGTYDGSRGFLDQLTAAGIDFDDVTEHLERDGLAKFEKSWSELGATVAAELERQHPPTRSSGLEPGSPAGCSLPRGPCHPDHSVS
jgi:hypothetical protein